MDLGDAEKASKDVYEMVSGVNDPYGSRRKRRVDDKLAELHTENRNDYIDGHQGEDIRDVNWSVD